MKDTKVLASAVKFCNRLLSCGIPAQHRSSILQIKATLENKLAVANIQRKYGGIHA